VAECDYCFDIDDSEEDDLMFCDNDSNSDE
jgi:hypothetical protein